MGKDKTLILIDGHALAFREYYALERTRMQTSNGQPTWMVYGFFREIFDLLKNHDIKTDAIAVTFDVSHQTFRVEKYEKYKSNREQMPDPMKSQMELLYAGLKAFNIPIYTKEGFEADDVIGTISKQACELGHKVLILTGDQDAFQLIDKEGCVKVIIPTKGELKEYDWQGVYDKLGVYPNQVVDYKSLRGDRSDCIPGVNGIGDKIARDLLAEYGTLDEILANVDNIQNKSTREKIKNGVEDAHLSNYLATIVRDLDVNFDFDKTKVEIPNVRAVKKFLTDLQFHSFLRNINSILYSFDQESIRELLEEEDKEEASNSEPIVNTENNNTSEQLDLFAQSVQKDLNEDSKVKCNSKLVTDSIDFENMCGELIKHGIFSLNVIANFTNAVDNDIIGISIAYKDGFKYVDKKFDNSNNEISAFYIPLKSTVVEKRLDLGYVVSTLKPILENSEIYKVTYNSKDLYNILRNCSIDIQGIVYDIGLASYVSNPANMHEIDIQAIDYLNHTIHEFAEPDEIKKLKLTYENVSAERLLQKFCEEASTIIELAAYWNEHLSDKELKILYDIELPLSKVLADMEYKGVSIDIEYLKQLSASMNEKLSALEIRIYEIAGEKFNINSPKQVSEILYDKLHLTTAKRKKKSTSAEVLEELSQENEIARLILDYRKFSKLKSTYTDALQGLVSKKDNRIHTSFNQTVTATGRLSSSNPNLQNIPARTEEGNKIRLAFVPENKEDFVILSADYSQIELRLLAHISKDAHLIEGFVNDVDVHALTASKVYGVPIENVTKEMRYGSKAVNFGIIYGQTKYGLARTLGIKNNAAEDFINKYFETYPNIKLYMDSTVQFAKENGYVETVMGRKRYLPEMRSSNPMIREFAKRAAINQPIQGTAADLMKLAMVECAKLFKEYNLKSKMILQVHDEIVVETLKSELDTVNEVVRRAMELNQPLDVPLKIDINTGESWQEQ